MTVQDLLEAPEYLDGKRWIEFVENGNRVQIRRRGDATEMRATVGGQWRLFDPHA